MSVARLLYRNRVNAWAARAISSPVSYGGHEYQADADSRATIAGWAAHIASGGALPDGFVWRDAANEDVVMESEDIIGLNETFVRRAHDVRVTGWAIKQQLDGTDSPDEADALLAGIGA